jgi:hypothetical protein
MVWAGEHFNAPRRHESPDVVLCSTWTPTVSIAVTFNLPPLLMMRIRLPLMNAPTDDGSAYGDRAAMASAVASAAGGPLMPTCDESGDRSEQRMRYVKLRP